MKRAILVSAGTVAGLAAVLTYSSGAVPLAVAADVPGGSNVPGLGGPAPDTSDSPSAAPSRSAAAKPKPAASAKPGTTAKPAAKPAAATTASAPTATPKPAATPKATPKPKPKPKPAPPTVQTFMGSAVQYKYGTLQMAIKVKGGKVIDAWAVKYPGGDSQPYSEMAIPILRSHTIGTHTANIAGATGASLTTAAWRSSLAGALAKAGI